MERNLEVLNFLELIKLQDIYTLKKSSISIDLSNIKIIMIMLFILCIFVGIILILIGKNSGINSKIKEENKKEITDDLIKKIDTTLNSKEIKEEAFSLYKKLEVAKTKKDNNTIKEILTEELYLEKIKELEELKKLGQKLVATNIKLQDSKILSIKKENKKIIANIYLYVSQYDYVIDKKKNIVRGNDKSEYQIEYKLTIEKNEDDNFKISKKECTGKWIKNY